MTQVVLFHHVQGLTDGIVHFAERWRRAGHDVVTPDLFGGATFATIEDGMGFAREVGFETIVHRGRDAVEGLAENVVYSGFSLGVMSAQMLAQTRPGARGALLFHSCLPRSEFGDAWPSGVPAQIHAMDADPFFVDEGDIDAARELGAEVPEVELFLYPGNQHLFTDDSLAAYDAAATDLLIARTTEFLNRIP